MERRGVVSTNIRSIGYDEESRILEVEYLTGAVYEYHDVPPELYSGLMAAASHGGYLSRHVKNRYRYRRIS